MPYKDPEKRREVQRESLRRARERDPERFREYQRKHRANLTSEQKAERRQKWLEWAERTGYRRPASKRADGAVRAPRRSREEVREEFRANPDDPRHGTHNGYGNLLCRCDRCRAANAAYHLAYMQRRRAQEATS